MKLLHPDIAATCIRADEVLWAAFAKSQQASPYGASVGKLLFPKYRNNDLRVSEQEARFAFVEGLYPAPLLYAVEAPTSKKYTFKGDKSLSAQTDLAVYDVTGVRLCNVEFKAKGVSPSAKSHFPIYKDLQKLLREPLWGLWFHLLAAVDNSTINDLLSVMVSEMVAVCRKFSDIKSPGITVHICVLKHDFAIQKDLFLGHDLKSLQDEVKINLKVTRSKLKSVDDANGWSLHTWRKPAR